MRNRLACSFSIGFFSAVCTISGVASVIRQWDLPELVSKAPLIVTGHVAVMNGTPILIVDTVLKGEVPRRTLYVEAECAGDMPPVEFVDGENLVLFLNEATQDDKVTLFGLGDQGKWPRTPVSGGFPMVLNERSFDDIVGMIQGLMQIDEFRDRDVKIALLAQWMRSPDKAKQILALQYITDDLIWARRDDLSGKIFVNPNERREVLERFLPDLSHLAESDDPLIRREAVRALRFGPYALAKPILDKVANDTDQSVRTAVDEVQTTLTAQGQPEVDGN